VYQEKHTKSTRNLSTMKGELACENTSSKVGDDIFVESCFRSNSADLDTQDLCSSDSDESMDCFSADDPVELKDAIENEPFDSRGGDIFCVHDDHSVEQSTEKTRWCGESRNCEAGRGAPDFPEGKCKAFKLLCSTLRLRQHRHGGAHSLVASAWNEIGNYYSSSGDNAKAIASYQRATKCNRSSDVAHAYLNLGICSLSLDKLNESVDFCNQALDVLNTLDLNDMERCRDVAAIYHQLGNAFCRKKQFAEATDYLDRAIEMYRLVNDTDDAFVATVVDSTARVLSLRGDSQAALAAHVNALSMFFAAEKCDRAATQCLEDIASVCCKNNEYERSIKALTKKMQLHSLFLSACQADPDKIFLIPVEVSAIVDTVIAIGKVQELRGFPRESYQCEAEADFLYDALLSYQDKRVE
jgi:tetratricopeptide (TPR) repeat protein